MKNTYNDVSPHFFRDGFRGVVASSASLLERAHALAISYKTSACMREVNYIAVTDLTRTINRDLMVWKRPAALIALNLFS